MNKNYINNLTQKQYNNLMTEGEAVKQILSKTLKLYYTDINIIMSITEFCNKLWEMNHLEVREIEDFNLEIVCYKTVDGYDNEIIKYCLIN